VTRKLTVGSVARSALWIAGLTVASVTCKDLTGPTGVAKNGSTVTVTYLGPRDAAGIVQLIVGNRVSPPVEVRLNGVVATRATYVFSVKSDSVMRILPGGDSLLAIGRGRDTIIVTVVGATMVPCPASPSRRSAV